MLVGDLCVVFTERSIQALCPFWMLAAYQLCALQMFSPSQSVAPSPFIVPFYQCEVFGEGECTAWRLQETIVGGSKEHRCRVITQACL